MHAGVFYEDDKYKIQGWWATGSYFEVVSKTTNDVVHTGFYNHSVDLSFDECWKRLIKETENK